MNSQYFEESLVSCAISLISESGYQVKPWCVEFGAGDGVSCSNTRKLIESDGFYSIQIEGDEHEYERLIKTYRGNDRVTVIRKWVSFEGDDRLDTVLSKTACPRDFCFLSIDIDGNDVHVFEAMCEYRPLLVMIEFNPSFPNEIEFKQPRNLGVQQGSSLRAIVNSARRKGYELIGVTNINALFVIDGLFGKFNMKTNDIADLYDNKRYLTNLAQLYDGSLVVSGNKTLIWHRISIEDDDIQVLPKSLRSYPASLLVRKIQGSRVLSEDDGVVRVDNIEWFRRMTIKVN